MSYIKPQTPLQHKDGDYFYPLTTADQVIMPDGSRLNKLATPKAGFIYPLASSVVPEGFLLCDGAEYLRTEYPELFAAIGTIYGSGDGSTTFNVPNLQTRVPVGSGEGYNLGDIGGEETHTLTINEMPSHKHAPSNRDSAGSDTTYKRQFTTNLHTDSDSTGRGQVTTSSNSGEYAMLATTSSDITGADYTTNVGGSEAHNNMQPYTVINYIIAIGKDTGVSVADIITGAQALPLGVEYGGTGATNTADARRNLEITPENIGAMSMELRWENASPTSEFVSQIVDVTVNDNEGVAIEFRNTYDQPILSHFELFTHDVVYEFFSADGYGRIRSRKVIVRNKKIDFTDAYAYNTYGSYKKDNTAMLPFRIYIIKGVSA